MTKLADWTRERLLELLPEWVSRSVTRWPRWLLTLFVPVVLFILVGLALQWSHGILEAYRETARVMSDDGGADPATEAGQESIRRELEAARAESAAMRAKLDAILAALNPPAGAAPLGAEAAAAKQQAAVGLVRDPAPSAQQAARDLAAGDLRAGFEALEREARQAETAAAEKWRRLGALASGVDTARARAAYEQAFRLDPTDFWTCIMLARLRDEAGDIAAARDAATAAAQAARTDRERSVADNELGDVLVKAGDLTAARARYEAGWSVAERLAAQNPGSAEAARDLSVSLNTLGDVLVKAGDLTAARARYEAGLAIAERLAAQNPGSAEAARDLSVSLWKLASLDGSGVSWQRVVRRMEAMQARGILAPPDVPLLEMARRNAKAR